MQRADALYDFLPMHTHAGRSGRTLAGDFWRGRLDGVSGTLGFPLERRVSLMFITMLVASTGVSRTLLQRLLGGWASALAFRREAFACLGVACSVAATLPPSRRCRVNGALLDEFLLVTKLALLLQTYLRAEPTEKLFAIDASPSGAGGCAAPITEEAWVDLYDLAEEKGEHVRLDWKGEEPPSSTMDVQPLPHLL